MIPNNRSLVPLCEARRAMLQAVDYVEHRRERQTLRADFPYAQAFFRFLKGSKRITLRELRFFHPILREEELRGRRREWLRAVALTPFLTRSHSPKNRLACAAASGTPVFRSAAGATLPFAAMNSPKQG